MNTTGQFNNAVRFPLPPEEARTLAQRIHAAQDAFSSVATCARSYCAGQKIDQLALFGNLSAIVGNLIDNAELRLRLISYLDHQSHYHKFLCRAHGVRADIIELCGAATRNVGNGNILGCTLIVMKLRTIFDSLIENEELRERVMQHLVCRAEAEFPHQGRLI